MLNRTKSLFSLSRLRHALLTRSLHQSHWQCLFPGFSAEEKRAALRNLEDFRITAEKYQVDLAWATAHLIHESSMQQLPEIDRLPEGLEVVFHILANSKVRRVSQLQTQQDHKAVQLAHEIIDFLRHRDSVLAAFENEIKPLTEFLYLFHTLNPTDMQKRHQYYCNDPVNYREMINTVMMWQDLDMVSKQFSGLLKLSRRAKQLYNEADRLLGGAVSGLVAVDSVGEGSADNLISRQPFRGQ
ncbi:hypothetical protein BDD12DRAFT_873537 [Trichophaea hybrida]|nr:hypothetical protein BDD12DRAFT_873537 [Trichophaea hybrida]